MRIMLIMVFAVLFILLYVAEIWVVNPILTKPKLSQFDAVKVAEQRIRADYKNVTEVRLYWAEYNQTAKPRPEFPWQVSTVQQNPQFLSIPLKYLDSNGTLFFIDPSSASIYHRCDAYDINRNCFTTRQETLNSVKSHLFYQVELKWTIPANNNSTKSFTGYYFVNALNSQVIHADRFSD